MAASPDPLLRLIFLLVLLLPLSGCGEGGPSPFRAASRAAPAPARALEGRLEVIATAGRVPANAFRAFEQESRCRIELAVARGPAELLELAAQRDADLVLASGENAASLVAAGRVRALDPVRLPALAQTPERLRDLPGALADGRRYGLPWRWQANVLAYDSKREAQAPTSWKFYFEPAEGESAPRLLASAEPVAIADAAIYLAATQPGLRIGDPHALDERQYAAALALLQRQHLAWRGAAGPDVAAQVEGFPQRRRGEPVHAGGGAGIAGAGTAGGVDAAGRGWQRGSRNRDAAFGCAPSQLRVGLAAVGIDAAGAGASCRRGRRAASAARRLQARAAGRRRCLRTRRHGAAAAPASAHGAAGKLWCAALRAVQSLDARLPRATGKLRMSPMVLRKPLLLSTTVLLLAACVKDAAPPAPPAQAYVAAVPAAAKVAADTPAGNAGPRRVLHDWLGAWNAHDLGQATALLADDVEYFDAGFAGIQHGREAAIEKGMSVFLRGVPDLHLDVRGEPIVGADAVAWEWTLSGTNTGTWGGIPATNQQIRLKASA
jgi:hypothetical protein